jgi:imidazolonepropionase-like amidohydrolase
VSVGRLDLLAEARAARVLAGLSAERALALVTLEAARALGMEDEVGSLTPGKWGDIAVVRLRNAHPTAAELLDTGAEDIVATYLGGRLVFGGHPA